MFTFKGLSGYILILSLMILEGTGLPIPSEVIMPLTGYFSKLGYINFVIGVLMGTLGSLIGSIIDYFLSLKFGPFFIRKFGKYIMLTEEREKKLMVWFQKYGAFAVFSFRFVPEFRALISIPAGLVKMNLIKFIVFTFLGHLIWDVSLAFIGFVFYDKIDYVISLAEKFGDIVLVITVVVVAYYVVRIIYRS